MAELIPSLEKINNMNPTDVELELLEKLERGLESDYKIYYKPFLNGDRPDIVVLKENLGILIIEVNDWNIDEYSIEKEVVCGDNSIGFKGNIDENERSVIFRLKENNLMVENPFEKINRYKTEFYGPHIERLFMEKVKEPKLFGNIVRTAVYFKKEKENKIQNIFSRFNDKTKKNTPIFADIFYAKKWGYDTDIISEIKKDYNIRKKYGSENFFELAKENNVKFKRKLDPPFHYIDRGEYVNFVKKQKSLAVSKSNEQKKIKGVAGSGKTLLLAHRAVSAAKRTNKTVLILTYNITICNYIKDRIDKVKDNFSWDKFEIKNYHSFIKEQLKKCGYVNMQLFDKDDPKQNKKIEDEIYNVFQKNRGILKKYDAIFIDECQDFCKNWLKTIKNNFLAENGEFVIFADEKQNIYKRDLDKEKKVETNIAGKWNELNQSFRVKNKISKLAELFQKEFMDGKYELDNFENEQIAFGENSGEILYRFGKNISDEEIESTLSKFLDERSIHDNKVCILGMKVENVRRLEKYIRDKKGIEFELDIETEEEYEEIRNKCENKDGVESFKRELEERRRVRKKHFSLDSGKMKISTTHSFKGWELENIVLIIDSDDGNTTDELIYTAFTRSKENLIIFNRGNWKIDKFFREKVDYTSI